MKQAVKKKMVYPERGRRVFVGLSGGVDSSVSAALLKEKGYEVVGVFMKTWSPDFLPCAWREERRDAMRVAAHLDIPFLTFDLEKEYKREVADYMIREYKAGRTPNPDVMCNKMVKFGAFLKKALSMGADYIATGHYAQISGGNLLAGADPSKDQSYFLWTLNQDQLKRILFPIGHLKKEAVRKLAKKYGLHTAEKKDSQGVCFLGKLDMKEFLKHYIKPKKGQALLIPSEVEGEKNNVIGWHDGAVFYTLGERHGFTVTKKSPHDKPYYVVGKDVKKNILFVSQRKSFTPESTDNFLKNTNWIAGEPDPKETYHCQTRYHGEKIPCRIKILKNNKVGDPERSRRAEIIFPAATPGVAAAAGLPAKALAAAGQSLVLYDGDICLGGGVIE